MVDIGGVSSGYAILIAIVCFMVLFTLCASKVCAGLRTCAGMRPARVSSQREEASVATDGSEDRDMKRLEEGAADKCKSVQMYHDFSSKGTRVEGEEEEVCSICMEELGKGIKGLFVLPNCGHIFHAACVNAWLPSNASCPLCRVLSAIASPLPRPLLHSPQPS